MPRFVITITGNAIVEVEGGDGALGVAIAKADDIARSLRAELKAHDEGAWTEYAVEDFD